MNRRILFAPVMLLVMACQAAAAPTPQIIYVTPAPTATAAAVASVAPASASPTAIAAISLTPTPVPTPTPTPTAPPTPQPTEKPWFPSGYQLVLDNPPIAFRWLKASEYSCGQFSSGCWGAMFIARDGCSSMLVTLSVEDSSGTVVGSANGSAQGVGPGQKAKIIFDDFLANGGTSARISQVYCY